VVRLPLLLLSLTLALLLVLSGCVEEESRLSGDFSVDEAGHLSLTCPPCMAEETVLSEEDGYTVYGVVFRNTEGDVYAISALPQTPRAGFVLAPGAGVKKEGHRGRAERYAGAGYAYLVLDVRGNGGETGGHPLDLEKDFRQFVDHEWPQYYLSVCDMQCARSYLQEKNAMPVYAIGESNGGRYAAIAAALDRDFTGYIGVSTSGFSGAGESYTGDARRFLLSVDPETCAGDMAPRSSWIFHAPGDPIIPYALGQSLYDTLPEPKVFFSFNGPHGLNEEVDARILGECTQIYGSGS
jgi:hypothetical protein